MSAPEGGQAYSREAILVIPHAEWLLGYEQVQAQALAKRAAPSAVQAREASTLEFAGFDTPRAVALARSSFPRLVTHVNGGPPQMPAGERITQASGDYAAAVRMPDGKRAIVASSDPMFVKTAAGRRSVDLHLRPTAGGFSPRRPATGVYVRIPDKLSSGPGLSDLGISLTPIDRDGVTLSSSPGSIQGATVFYGRSERAAAGVRDVDTLVKPESTGFAEETLLRSARSPKKLFYRLSIPAGARLLHKTGSMQVRVLQAGRVIATIAAPAAQDAEGTAIPLTLGLSGRTLTLAIKRRPGQYRFPIAVDPYVTDYQLNIEGAEPTNWHFAHSAGTAFTGSENPEEKGWTEHISGSHSSTEWGAFEYTTQGTSYITWASIEGVWHDNGANVTNRLTLAGPGGVESESPMPTEWTGGGTWSVCAPKPTCTGKAGAGNTASWEQLANNVGVGTGGENTLQKASITIEQPTGPTLTFNKTSPTLPNGMPNALYGTSAWLGAGTGIEVKAHDPGVGISYVSLSAGSWVEQLKLLAKGECLGGVQCPENVNPIITGEPSMGEGEVSIEGLAYDSMNSYVMESAYNVKVDGAPPHNLTLTGLPANHEIGFKTYNLQTEASDGTIKASSGIKSMALKVDGHEIGSPSGSCSPGPCTAKSNAFTIDGHKYAAGSHLLTVVATDNAGNVETEDFNVTVRSASPVSLGPGEVNPETGEFALQATDVKEGEGLSVTRSYRSQHLLAGSGGPLGAQWAISTGSMESLEPQPEGGVILTDNSGAQVIFASNGSGGYTSPPGDGNLSLSRHEAEGVTEYVLSNLAKGTSIRFTLPGGGGTLWVPTVQEGPVATDTNTYRFETVEVGGKKVTRPVEEIGPVPAGVSCSLGAKRGCRVLKFNYATSTTATGENEGLWGDYNGNLTRVYVAAYDPAVGWMETKTIAQYSYDIKGRLRAEWNPEISPPLKTIYGYDSENHLTALTPPGQETFAFTYGQEPTDSVNGRIQRVTRAPASAPLWAGSAPSNTVAPAITPEEPVIGSSMTVSSGTWSGSPVAYRYQWLRCNTSGEECVAITRARNEAYKSTLADTGHKLKVEVQAANGGGSIAAYSAVVAPVNTPAYQSKFGSSGTGNGQFKTPAGSAIDSSGNVWVADLGNNRVQKLSASGEYLGQFGSVGSGNGQFKAPVDVAVTPEGNLWVTDMENNRIEEFSAAGSYITQVGTYGSGTSQFNSPYDLAVDGSGNVWVADMGNARVEEFSSTGAFVRQFGSRGSGTGQFEIVTDVAIDPQGHIWVLDSGNCNVQEFSSTGTYMTAFGSVGSGNGQFSKPMGLSIDSTGNMWVSDESSRRVQEFSPAGQYITKFGSVGAGNGQFKTPDWLTVSSSGTVYVSDTGNQRLQTFAIPSPALAYQSKFGSSGTGNGQFKSSAGSTIDSSGNIWVADSGNNRVQKFSASGEYLSQFGSVGTGNGQFKAPTDIAVAPEGNLWVTDMENNRIEEFSAAGSYITKVGTYGSGTSQFNSPYDLAVDGSGNVWVTDMGNARVEEFSSTGTFVRQFGSRGSGAGQFEQPADIAIDPQGHVWVLDVGNRNVQEFSSTGTYMTAFGSAGSGNGQFTTPWGLAIDSTGHMWIGDGGSKRVQVFTAAGQYVTKFGSAGTGDGQFKAPDWITVSSSGVAYVSDTANQRIQLLVAAGSPEPAAAPTTEGAALTTIEYGVPVSGTGAPQKLGSSDVAGWGQSDDPIEGTAIFPPDKPEGWPAPEADYKRATIYYYDERGRTVNVALPAGGIATTEFNETNDATRELSAANRATALAEGAKSAEASHLLDTQLTYNGDGTELLSELGPRHTVKLASGEEVAARKHVVYSYDESAPAGGPYRLVTKITEGAQIEGKPEQDIRTTTMSYSGQSNLGWKLREPTSITTDPVGLKLTQTFVYDSTTGNVVESRKPASGGEGNAHDTKTIYYTNAANGAYPSCGNRAEWANLPCETLPGAQPGTSGLPNLPVTLVTYNYQFELSEVIETVGTDMRTTKMTYDGAGRRTKSTVTSSVGTTLPEVTDEYDGKTGALIRQNTKVEGVTTSVVHAYNTLGQVTSYTDGDGTASTYQYDVDGRNTFLNDGKGTQTYKYDTTTGLEKELVDSAAGTFKATYDVEGNLLTETIPGGLTAQYTYNASGEVIRLEDIKKSSCGTSCTWFNQTLSSSIHGQTVSQTNTLAQNGYKYDEDGRLVEATETPTGLGCTAHLYSYDAETNGTSLTTRAPGAEGKCATEGGTVSSHSYDSGNRLTDTGVKYDSFGDTTILPAADAGGSELTSTFYASSRLASLKQGGQTVSYKLDPARRVREIVSTGTISSTVVDHYAGGGDSPSWIVDLAGKWTRYISGIGGELAAIQTNGETPVMQLTDLHGNVVATASRTEAVTALLSTTRSTEYGVPTTGSPPKYSWLGGPQRPTELPSGVVAMGVRAYVPQLGRFLQVDPLMGGSDNPYGYADGDPVNSFDLTGEYVENDYMESVHEEQKELVIEERIAAEEAAREEAERKAEEAAEAAAAIQVSFRPSGSGRKAGHQVRHQGGASVSLFRNGGPRAKPAKKGGPYKHAHPGLGGKSKEPNHRSKKEIEEKERIEAEGAVRESIIKAEESEEVKIIGGY